MTSPSKTPSAGPVEIMNFDTDGTWDKAEHDGPAIQTRLWFRNHFLVLFGIQWLDLSETANKSDAKNHAVGTGILANPIWREDKPYGSVGISMETAEVLKKVADDGWASGPTSISTRPYGSSFHASGDQFYPGILTVALPEYLSPTLCSAHNLTDALVTGTAVGGVIIETLSLNMNHYLFLPRWEGCGDSCASFPSGI